MTAIVQLSIVNSFNTTFFVTNINRAPTCCKHKFDIFIFFLKIKQTCIWLGRILRMPNKLQRNTLQTPKIPPWQTQNWYLTHIHHSDEYCEINCYNADCCCGNKYELRVQLPSDLITILHGFSGRQPGFLLLLAVILPTYYTRHSKS